MDAGHVNGEGGNSESVCVCVCVNAATTTRLPIGARVELPPSHTIIWPIMVVLTGKLEEASPRASPQEGHSAPAHGLLLL